MVHELVRYMKSVNMHGEKIKEKTKKYCKLKEEAQDCILWRTHFGRGYGAV